MMNILHHYLGTKLLNRIEPEVAHSIAVCYLKLVHQLPKIKTRRNPLLETKICGIKCPSPIGLAAGFDKNAEIFNATLSMGFGFVEVGTITPDPQYGNLKPRLFRLPDEDALINKLGFNNKGMLYAAKKCKKT